MLTDHRSDPNRDLRPHSQVKIHHTPLCRGVYGVGMSRPRSVLVAALGVMAISVAPAGAAPPGDDNAPPADDLDGYPIAAGQDEGLYGGLSPGKPNFWGYWLYFKTPDGRSCGLAPNSGPIGCDAVAGDAAPGTNQGAVHCQTAGNHGFTLSADDGVLW